MSTNPLPPSIADGLNAIVQSLEAGHGGYMIGCDKADADPNSYRAGFTNGFGECLRLLKLKIDRLHIAAGAAATEPPGWQWFLKDLLDLCEIGDINEESEHEGWAQIFVEATAMLASRAAGPFETHGLDTQQQVLFYEQDFYVLSNFSSFRVAMTVFSAVTGRPRTLSFDTAEHCYHWHKFQDTAPDVATAIFAAGSAHDAFKIAQDNKGKRRADWDEVKVGLMRDILRHKAYQHHYVMRKLLATGDRELIENSWRDDFWGWGPKGDGLNMLGKLWMEVRTELRAPMQQQP